MIPPCMTWHILYVYYLRVETWFTAKQFPGDLNFRSLDKKNRDVENGKLYFSLSLSLSCLNACVLASLYALLLLCMRLRSTILQFQNILVVTSTFSFTSSRGVFTHKNHMTKNLKIVFFAPPIINLC